MLESTRATAKRGGTGGALSKTKQMEEVGARMQGNGITVRVLIRVGAGNARETKRNRILIF